MLVVGGQEVIANDNNLENILRFYGGLFGRLKNEVKNTGELTRHVGYQSNVEGQARLHFFGIEVEELEDVPDGMVGWELTGDRWKLWQPENGQDVVVEEKHIRWHWIETSEVAGGRPIGEFAVVGPEEHCGEFWISANAYVRMNEQDACTDEVELVDYDASWPDRFEQFAGWLYEKVGHDTVLRLEHFGSTAIQAMPAKPIIDVLMEVPSFAEAKKRVLPILNNELWEYWWYSDHMILIRRERLMGRRTHHLHIAPNGHRLWEGLLFRDYLREHGEDALRYAALKRRLAAEYHEDRERYTEAKTAFVKEILARSKAAGQDD